MTEEEIKAFCRGQIAHQKIPRYIPSNPVALYHVLEFVTSQDLPLGRIFCNAPGIFLSILIVLFYAGALILK